VRHLVNFSRPLWPGGSRGRSIATARSRCKPMTITSIAVACHLMSNCFFQQARQYLCERADKGAADGSVEDH
jgi:hypothetical protein